MAQFQIVDGLGNVRSFFRSPRGSWHLVTAQRYALSLNYITDRPVALLAALAAARNDTGDMLRVIRAHAPGHTVTAL